MANPWEMDWAQQNTSSFIPPHPDIARRAAEEEERQRQAAAIQAENAARAAESHEREPGNKLFERTTASRGEFFGLEPVQTYRAALGAYNSALSTADNAAGDQSLITSYAKMTDPNTGVREGEFQTTAEVEAKAKQILVDLKRQFGVDGAGRLSPEGRLHVRREIRNLVETRYKPAYEQARSYYTQLAERAGMDPFEVIGPNFYEPYQESIESYWRKVEEGDVKEPTAAQVYADGAVFGDDMGDDAPFDRGEYLAERYGLKQGDEALISAFWNAQRGNANLSPQAVKEWYQGRGIALPSDEDIMAGVKAAQEGKAFGSFDTSQAQQDYTNQLDAALAQRGADPESISGASMIGAQQGITFRGLDEIAGVSGALGGLFRGQNPLDAYGAERDIVRREFQRAESAHPYITGGAEIGGALVTGGAGFGTPMRAAGLASQARQMGNISRANALGRTAVRSSIAPGAATGGAYGFGAGEGGVDSLMQGTIGAGAGAVAAPAMQAGMNALAPKIQAGVNALGLNNIVSRPPAPNADVIQAGARRQVPIRQPDARPEVRGEYGVARTSQRGGPIIRDAEAQDVQAMERAVFRDVAHERPTVGREGVGNAGATAVNRQSDKLKTEARAWYNRADKAAGGVVVPPTEALSRLDNHIATLRQNGANANKNTIKYLEGLREDFASGLTVAGIRDQRTNMRSNIREAGLDVNKTEALVLDIISGASADLQRGLASNPRALRAYQNGDKVWAERAAFKKEVQRTLLGPSGDRSSEAVADNIRRLARDDFATFQKFWDVLEPDEQADIAATFAIGLGRDASDNWSPARFVSDLTGSDLGTKSKISPRALRLMFGADGVKAIEDLKVIARAKKDAASEVNNSRTGNIVQKVGRGLRGLLLTGLGFAGGGVTGAMVAPAAGNVLTSLGEKRAARLLLNSDFTRWLRTAPNTSDPRAIDRHFARLDSIAARTPGMAADVDVLRQSLFAGANDNVGVVTRSAASGTGSDSDRDEQY